MTERNIRIRQAIDSRSSQQKVGDRLGISRQAVNMRLTADKDIDSIEFIEAVSELTGYSAIELLYGDTKGTSNSVPRLARDIAYSMAHPDDMPPANLAREDESINKDYLTGKNIRPVTVTVDRTGKELITYVPVRAQAGYRRGFGDPQYIEKLPAFSLPINVLGTHRMFQVDGNSMRQLGGGGLNDGDIVIASYIEDIFSMKDGRVYVIVNTEGVIVKRCINRLLTADRVLVANSDNKSGEYPPIILHPNEILEVWELKAFISKQLSLATDLWDIVNDLQVKQAMMDDELKNLKQLRK